MTGEHIFDGTSMLSLSESQLKKYRGKDVAMVVQEQGSRAFDPSTTVGKQMFNYEKYIRQCLRKKMKEHD